MRLDPAYLTAYPPPWGALLVLTLGNPGSAEVHKQYALNERYEIADEWIC